MNNSPVLPANPIETAKSAAHSTWGTTLVQVCPTGPGFGLLAIILGYAYTPFDGHIRKPISPKYKSGALRAPRRSPHTLRVRKILTGDLATRLLPTVWCTP